MKKAGSEVRVNALTLELMSVKGDISNKDIRKAVALVADNQQTIHQQWRDIHG